MFGRRDSYKNDQSHEHDHQHGIHVHMHGAMDPSIFATRNGWGIDFMGR
jgi:hypothetical protein